jgi:hypothetical protein
MSKRLGGLRDQLIAKARYGKIFPEEAEAQAKAAGLPPFETQPEFADFDPMAKSRWPIVQAIAWIAWRDLHLVLEQGNEFRRHCTRFTFREWKESAQSEQILEGWFLEPLPVSTAARLAFHYSELERNEQSPEAGRLNLRQAERELWEALAQENLKAEGFDKNGVPVDIPAREWTHLKLVEEHDEDVLKYDVISSDEPYTKVHFRRDDLIRLWPPRYKPVDIDSLDLGMIADLHLEPMKSLDSHIPLSVALAWVITHGGTIRVPVRDEEAWHSGVGKLLPKISGGSIEIIGRDEGDTSDRLPALAFASIAVPWPVFRSLSDIFAESEAHIRCCLFSGKEEWKNGDNDQFFKKDSVNPHWTHLQVRREHVLKLWPAPTPKTKSQVDCRRWLVVHMRESPEERPKPKREFQAEALKKFRPLAARQFQTAWDEAIKESAAAGWSQAGRPKKKSNHRIK